LGRNNQHFNYWSNGMKHQERAGVKFEDQVRQVAAAVWGLEPGQCQPAEYHANQKLREIDAIVVVNDVLHLIMATTRTDLEKAREDCERLNWAEKHFSKSHDLIKKWFITRDQLQAPHHDVARRHKVTAVTLDEFKRRSFDGTEYVRLRNEAPFGSARDPVTNATKIGKNVYVPLPLNRQEIRSKTIVTTPVTLAWVTERIAKGRIIVLTAPFGGGKSLSTREIFRQLANQAVKSNNGPWPLTLNLRDHYGQTAGDEILERHARTIGFSKMSQLVAAWRSGLAHLLLDGFDEVGAQALFQADNKNFMRSARRQALAGVRSLLTAMPHGAGVLLCGRDNFFDDHNEMATALALDNNDFDIVTLEEFDENSARSFLSKNNIHRELPDWLPRKPLILSYLLRNNLLDDIVHIDGSLGFARAWNIFIDRICQREAQLPHSVIEPRTLRHMLERLALLVRSRTSGDGPISGSDMADAYRLETGQEPADSVLTQLQRLPGLAQRDNEPSARSFVDTDMLSALQGSAFARLILGAIGDNDFNKYSDLFAKVPLSDLSRRAVDMAAYLLHDLGAAPETVVAKAERLSADARRDAGAMQNAADTVAVAVALARDARLDSISFRGLIIKGAMVGRISGEEVSVRDLRFRECNVDEITLDGLHNVSFERCMISKLSGAADDRSLPDGFLIGSDVSEYDNMSTNNAIQQLPLAPQLKALLITLRKLYLQAGSGRAKSALYRGMPGSIAKFVDPVLRVLQTHHVIDVSSGDVVHPVRRQTIRVHRILGSPSLSQDDIVLDVLKL
jgi:hypothetical protein